ncbi:hypothetical protein Tco_1018972 [Tanacetum coccineum]|uniref:Transmembrane protein n=1 Tax=Tanacetum coccineum TaxID=301880 RepID=A0ABQ5FY92_9ASTR
MWCVASVVMEAVVVWVVRGDDDVVDWNGGGDVDVEWRWRWWRYCVAVVWMVARRSRRKWGRRRWPEKWRGKGVGG